MTDFYRALKAKAKAKARRNVAAEAHKHAGAKLSEVRMYSFSAIKRVVFSVLIAITNECAESDI